MRRPQARRITQQVERRAKLLAVRPNEAQHEREQADVPVVALGVRIVRVVDRQVAERAARRVPVQVDEVLADRMLVAHVLLCIVHVAQLRRDAAHRTRKRAHPREQVDVQLADVRHARAWVVVEAGREHMAV